MRAVDTNVLVRLITRDDARQLAAAESFVNLARGCPIWPWLKRRGSSSRFTIAVRPKSPRPSRCSSTIRT